MNQELQDYIKKAKENGLGDEQIKQELLKAGWQEQDINLALSESRSFQVPNPESYSEEAGRKKPSKLATIILVVAPIILIIAGGALAYNYFIKPLGDKVINQNDTQNNAVETAKTETQKEETKDCGSIANTHFNIHSDQWTQQDEDSMKCINEALLNCNLAKIEFSEGKIEGPYADQNTGSSYEIKGKEGDRCIMTSNIYKPPSSKTCRIPMSFISMMKAEGDSFGKPDSLFLTTLILLAREDYPDPETGANISFECQ